MLPTTLPTINTHTVTKTDMVGWFIDTNKTNIFMTQLEVHRQNKTWNTKEDDHEPNTQDDMARSDGPED